MAKITRRDFLKLSAAFSASSLASKVDLSTVSLGQAPSSPNIIIILFDAMSASNLSLYGYQRETTPHFREFARRASVYHAHYAGGNFTTPGSASMLTGMYPWTHRAFHQNGLIKRDLLPYNLGGLLGGAYFRYAFPQNQWVARLLAQFGNEFDLVLRTDTFSLAGYELKNEISDRELGSGVFEDVILPSRGDISSSLFLSYLKKLTSLKNIENLEEDLKKEYPLGVPFATNAGIPYLNEDVFAGVSGEVEDLQKHNQSFLAYFHLWSPHFPFAVSRKFIKLFAKDGYVPVQKPVGPFSEKRPSEFLAKQRLAYDRQIAQVDFEFGKLMKSFERNGIFETSYVIVTSDHGEIHERGTAGHGGPLLYDPIIRIPLLISSPGRYESINITTPTSNTDILPTLLKLLGRSIPAELEGKLLPAFGEETDPNRPIFSMSLGDNSAFLPLRSGTIAMRKASYMLIRYFGYPNNEDLFELFDMDADPEQVKNIYEQGSALSKKLKDEMLANLDKANEIYY